jgi:hypothetical protein
VTSRGQGRGQSRPPRLRGFPSRKKPPKSPVVLEAPPTGAQQSPADQHHRGGRWIRLGVAVVLIATTVFLLPKQVQSAPGSAGDSRGGGQSVDSISVAALYSTPYGGEAYRANLSLDWSIDGGKSTATLFAIVNSPEGHGSLVLGGPIARLVSDCHLNGVPVAPTPDMPRDLGFNPPQNAQFWFDGRRGGTTSRIDFQGDPGSGRTVIRCDVHDFASDDAPLHRLYTPVLVAYSQGTESVSDRDLKIRDVCVEVTYPSVADRQAKCADAFNPAPVLYHSEKQISLPEEQGRRDAILIVLGAIAGAAASALLEVVTGFLSSLARKSRAR